MKIFVINRKNDIERRQRILHQFEKFNITNFEIVAAVDGKELQPAQLNEHYDKAAAQLIVRELAPLEIACALSHIEVCKRIIEYNKRCLIIEDDVLLSDEFKNFVDIEVEDPADVLFFGLYTSNYDAAGPKKYPYKNIRYSQNIAGITCRCYLEETYATLGGIEFYDIDEQSVKYDIFIGTHAYAPSVAGCHKIIKTNYPVKMMADYVWVSSDLTYKIPKQNIIEVDHSIQSTIATDRDRFHINGKYSEAYYSKITNQYHNG